MRFDDGYVHQTYVMIPMEVKMHGTMSKFKVDFKSKVAPEVLKDDKLMVELSQIHFVQPIQTKKRLLDQASRESVLIQRISVKFCGESPF